MDHLGLLSRGEGARRCWLVVVKHGLRHLFVELVRLGGLGKGGGEPEVVVIVVVRLT